MAGDVHPKIAMERLVRRISVLQDRALAAAGLDLTAKQATTLILLDVVGPRPMAVHQLASELGVDQSATTRLVDRLERRDLVARQRNDDDRRMVSVTLTPTGARIAVAAREVIETLKSELLAEIPAADLDTFWRVLGYMELAVATSACTREPEPR